MNQILSTGNNQKNYKRPIDTRKIIVFFCIVIFLFGITITSISTYSFYKEKTKDPIVEKLNKPEVFIEQLEDGSIKIIAKYDQGISKISYIWNDNNRTDSKGDGKTYIEKLIEIPSKNNSKLEVIVVGEDGREEKIIKEVEQSGDITKPVIDWVVSSNLAIIATDETGIAYLTYKWENEEEVMVEATEENQIKMEETIEIKRGTNELTVTAVDISGNTSTKTRTFQGVKEPEISWIKYGSTVEMTITHDMGFEKIIFIVNGHEYVYDKNYSGYDLSKAEVQFKTDLQVGENMITIKAYSNEGTEKVKEGKTTYNP